MSEIEFVHLSEVYERQIIELMNEEEVGKLLPLLSGGFSAADCRKFLAAKQQIWDEHGYGPWAFMINGEFAGWGGLQPEQGDADFALILHPDYWGWGRKIFEQVKQQAFGLMKLKSITILFPPNRTNSRAIKRFGFQQDGQISVGGEMFMRFRLLKP